VGRVGIALIIGLALVARVRTEPDKYEIYAVRFATIASFPVSSLVAGADRARRLDIAMMIWVLENMDTPQAGRADARRGIQPAHAGSHAQPREHARARHPRPRPGGVRSLSARQRADRADRMTHVPLCV